MFRSVFSSATIILPDVFYGCGTWSLTLREERWLRVFENRVLRRTFGPKMDEVTREWKNYCYAHGDICKLCGRFGKSWRVGWSWPRSGHLLGSFSLFFSVFFLLSARCWGMESFTLAAPLRCDRVEFLRCADGSKTKARCLDKYSVGA